MSAQSGRLSIHRGSGLISSIASAAGSVLNRAIDFLPVEIHVPGYQYCGPGTDLQTRLSKGDPGINQLDKACKEHDIAYAKYKDSQNRSRADRVLAERAWERVKASDANLSEKATAWAVTNIMKAKAKLGAGRKRNRIKKKKCVKNKRKNKQNKRKSTQKNKKRKTGKGLYLRPYKGSGCSKKKLNILNAINRIFS